jgi:hypothetical protein
MSGADFCGESPIHYQLLLSCLIQNSKVMSASCSGSSMMDIGIDFILAKLSGRCIEQFLDSKAPQVPARTVTFFIHHAKRRYLIITYPSRPDLLGSRGASPRTGFLSISTTDFAETWHLRTSPTYEPHNNASAATVHAKSDAFGHLEAL